MDLERSTMLYNISIYKYNKTISIYPVQKFIVLTHYEVADTSRHERYKRPRMCTPLVPK